MFNKLPKLLVFAFEYFILLSSISKKNYLNVFIILFVKYQYTRVITFLNSQVTNILTFAEHS